MVLRPENERISIAGQDLLQALCAIEVVLVSLHKIGALYSVTGDRSAYERETTRFVDGWRVAERLAEARAVLSRQFDSTLGDDDMDDLERALGALECWSGPGSLPARD